MASIITIVFVTLWVVSLSAYALGRLVSARHYVGIINTMAYVMHYKFYCSVNGRIISNDPDIQSRCSADKLALYLDPIFSIGDEVNNLSCNHVEFSKRDAECRISGVNLLGRRNKVLGFLIIVMRPDERGIVDIIANDFLEDAPFMAWMRNSDLGLDYGNRMYRTYFHIDGNLHELGNNSQDIATRANNSNKPLSQTVYVNLRNRRTSFEVTEIPIHHGSTVGYAIDTTEIREWRDRYNDALRAGYNFFSSSSVAIAIYSADKKLTYYNNAFLTLWSLDAAWLDNKPHYLDVLEKLRAKRMLPEQIYFPRFKEQQINLFASILDRPQEDFWHLPNGKTLYVVALSYTKDDVLFAYTDNTKQLEIERAYNTLVLVRKETLDNINEGVSVFAENGKLKLYNHKYAEMWGLDGTYLSSEPSIKSILDDIMSRYSAKDEDLWANVRRLAMAQLNIRTSGQIRIELSDGRIIDCRSAPLKDGCSLFTYLDVTDSITVERSLRDINTALKETENLKSQFFANVSYELRSPLTSIYGYAEILKKYHSKNMTDIQLSYIDYIIKESRKLMLLIGDMIPSAQVRAGGVDDDSNCDICEIVYSAIADVGSTIGGHDVDVVTDIPEDIPLIAGNRECIKRVVCKIVALSFLDDCCCVRIAVRHSESSDGVTLSVVHQNPRTSLYVQYHEINLNIIRKLADNYKIKLDICIENRQYRGVVLEFRAFNNQLA